MNELVERLKAWQEQNGHLMPPDKRKLLDDAIAALQCNAEPVASDARLEELLAGLIDEAVIEGASDHPSVIREAEALRQYVASLPAAQAIPEGMCLVPRKAMVFALGVLDARLQHNDGNHPDFHLASSCSDALHASLALAASQDKGGERG